MERDLDPPPAQSSLCRAGCGFYGSATTDGFCSKCFKETIKRKQDTNRLSPTPVTEMMGARPSTSSPLPDHPSFLPSGSREQETQSPAPSCSEEETQVSVGSGEEESKTPPVVKKTRCHTCKKRMGLTAFECRCGGVFCGTHRYSDTHQCPFDYKKLGQAEIRRNNPLISGEKIQKL